MKKIFFIITIIACLGFSFRIYQITKISENKQKKEEVQKIPFDFTNFGAHYLKNKNRNFVDSFQIGNSTYHIYDFKCYGYEEKTYELSYTIDIEYDVMRELVKDFKSDTLNICLYPYIGGICSKIKIIDVKCLEDVERARRNKYEHEIMTKCKELHKKIYNN